MALLEVVGLEKRFGGLHAVKGVSFSVENSQIVGLIGPNGAGKSTVLHLIAGIHKPTSGKIYFEDKEIQYLPIYKRIKMGIAVMFQHSRPLGRQTVYDNIKLSFLPNRFLFKTPGYVDDQVRKIAKMVRLEEVLSKYPNSLPFGIARAMELAKAIALNPKLLLLDEPFAGLNHAEVTEFSALIKSLRTERFSIILIDHNVKAVYDLVDYMVAIHSGSVIAQGAPQEVTSNKEVKRVFLGEETTFKREPSKISESQTTLLEVNIKSLKYNKAEALRDVNLSVKEGQFVSVVGLNGAGKSSLFKAIFSFVPYEGDISWQNQSLKHLSPAKIVEKGISFVPETRELFKYMSVEENLQLAAISLPNTELKNRLEEIYTIFPRLGERKKQTVHTLSGGEQQMLTISRALVQKPKMIVLDEPTLGLAPIVLETISKALEYLHKQMEITILLGEQNLHFALKHSDIIYLLEHGSLICGCTIEEYINKMGETKLL